MIIAPSFDKSTGSVRFHVLIGTHRVTAYVPADALQDHFGEGHPENEMLTALSRTPKQVRALVERKVGACGAGPILLSRTDLQSLAAHAPQEA